MDICNIYDLSIGYIMSFLNRYSLFLMGCWPVSSGVHYEVLTAH
jgi:hypothetical protein